MAFLKTGITLVMSAIFVTFAGAQEYELHGKITDSQTGETLFGANVMIDDGSGDVADMNGEYEIPLQAGDYTMTVSFVGYTTATRDFTISDSDKKIDVELTSEILDEVTVVADIAKFRETPVAFSSIKPKKIEEDLGQQDIPMLLNNTPGAYATQMGGGDGDARITIRGFSQRNIAIMIDGVPVNDMENGWVYWSNWFGLDNVTKNIQVQRGLAASKLALPSVGGTMNIITEGIESKQSASIEQEFGSDNYLRTSFGYNSGDMGNGWGFTAAGSYKRRDGWVDETWSKAWFYYAKVQKRTDNHIISLSAMGAPQSHAQRKYKQEIARYSMDYAEQIGIDTSIYYENTDNPNLDHGLRYNPFWGYVNRWTTNESGDTIYPGEEKIHEKVNSYHKPMFTLRDFWTLNDDMFISNIAYLSIGKGGGTGLDSQSGVEYDESGQIDFQKIYDNNRKTNWAEYIDGFPEGYKSNNFLRSSNNEHFWYGLISTFNYNISHKLEFSGGLDFRSYRGMHYQEVTDLLGGSYAIGTTNRTTDDKFKQVGDVVSYHNDGLVNWGGMFAQLKYKTGNLSSFINLTASYSGYKRIDYFKKKDLVFEDTIMRQAVGYEFADFADIYGVPDTVYYEGEAYTVNSQEARHAETDWYWTPGYTAKGGVNYNLNEHFNVFTNFGYMNNAPRFNNIYDYDNRLFEEIKNENVKALELGTAYFSKNFSAKINSYYTVWENKPSSGFSYPYRDPITDMQVILYVNINGMDAVHKGVEFDFIYKISDKLDVQGLVSFGDWRWASEDSVKVYDPDQQFVETIYFDADGIFVGNAAQTQYAANIRYEPIDNLYFKASYRHFMRHYADFNPLDLDPKEHPENFDEEGNPLQSWKVPDYGLMDLHAGYGIKIGKLRYDLRLGMLNLLNEVYISDATNNDTYNQFQYSDFDAKSASVFMGLGRRFNVSFKVTF